MMNFVTGHEYSGKNAEILMDLGFDETDAFVTFKQAIKLDGIVAKAGCVKRYTCIIRNCS